MPAARAGAGFKRQGQPTALFYDALARRVSTRVGELFEATLAQRLAGIDR